MRAASVRIGRQAAILSGVAAFFVLAPFARGAPSSRRTPRPKVSAPAPDDRENEVWLQALEFLEAERDSQGLQTMRARVLDERLERIPLLARLVEIEVRKRDRAGLRTLVQDIARKADCRSNAKGGTCVWLNGVWSGHLDSLFFYEDSAGKLERARRLLEQNDCASALAVLREAELREGPHRLILERLEKAQVCLGDNAQAQNTRTLIEQLRAL